MSSLRSLAGSCLVACVAPGWCSEPDEGHKSTKGQSTFDGLCWGPGCTNVMLMSRGLPLNTVDIGAGMSFRLRRLGGFREW